MVRELQTIKELGFNLLRKHAKIEPQRWYYHCDKLGLIVWQDMVNGGGPYKLWFVTYLTNVFQPLLRRLPDARPLWGLLGRETEAGREEYARELEATVKTLQCHPCVGCWVPFNEGWGQFDAAGAVEAIACVLAVKEGIVPPTIGYQEPDPECDLDYVPNQARQAQVDLALSASLGFGGHNAYLAFRRV